MATKVTIPAQIVRELSFPLPAGFMRLSALGRRGTALRLEAGCSSKAVSDGGFFAAFAS